MESTRKRDGEREQEKQKLLRRYRGWLLCFLVGLVVSGVTAFPLLWEMELLGRVINTPAAPLASPPDTQTPGMAQWLAVVRDGTRFSYSRYPFLAYGTDWLAFAHLVIAVFFIGPYREPVRYCGTLISGIIACVLVLPLALICGPLRGIPLYWRLIDCAFGIVGGVPLVCCLHLTSKLSALEPSVKAENKCLA